ncbi:MAG: hypothetical protein PWP65_386 [Clostridia bacterium]|nr:hypothetical protein [Clostridia bacterium]
MRQVIYLDVVLGINLLMDYIILWATAKLGQLPVSGWRLLAGAAAGAAYSLLLVLPVNGIPISFFLKILFSLVMILISFYPLTWRRFWQIFAYFYLVAFVMGGAIVGAIYLWGSREIAASTVGGAIVLAGSIHYTWLLAGLAAAILLSCWGAVFIKKNFWQSILRVPLVISIGGRRLAVKALVDTGNSLLDPLTRRPVIIVEYSAIKSLLPTELCREFDSQPDPDLSKIITSLEGTPLADKVHLIPFISLGKKNGMLLGLRPEEVVLLVENRLVKVKDVVLGIYQHRLSPEGNYRALLHPDLLQMNI